MSDLVVKEGAELAAAKAVEGNWSQFHGDASDILIPNLYLAQQMSDVVVQEKVSSGKIYRSTTKQGVGGKGEPLAVIPLWMTTTWVISKKQPGGQKFEFARTEAYTAQNAKREYEFVEEGLEAKAVKSLNFFVLLVSDITRAIEAKALAMETGDIPDLDASLLPCLLAFRSSSVKAGRALVTQFANAADIGVPPFSNFFLVDSELVEKDKNKYYVFNVGRDPKGSRVPAEYLPYCRKWYDIVSTTVVKVDESETSDILETAHTAPQAPTRF